VAPDLGEAGRCSYAMVFPANERSRWYEWWNLTRRLTGRTAKAGGCRAPPAAVEAVLHAEDKFVRNRVQNNVYAAFARDR
jgi:hypothetical protein